MRAKNNPNSTYACFVQVISVFLGKIRTSCFCGLAWTEGEDKHICTRDHIRNRFCPSPSPPDLKTNHPAVKPIAAVDLVQASQVSLSTAFSKLRRKTTHRTYTISCHHLSETLYKVRQTTWNQSSGKKMPKLRKCLLSLAFVVILAAVAVDGDDEECPEFSCPKPNGSFADPCTCRRFYKVIPTMKIY